MKTRKARKARGARRARKSEKKTRHKERVHAVGLLVNPCVGNLLGSGIPMPLSFGNSPSTVLGELSNNPSSLRTLLLPMETHAIAMGFTQIKARSLRYASLGAGLGVVSGIASGVMVPLFCYLLTTTYCYYYSYHHLLLTTYHYHYLPFHFCLPFLVVSLAASGWLLFGNMSVKLTRVEVYGEPEAASSFRHAKSTNLFLHLLTAGGLYFQAWAASTLLLYM